MVRIGIAEDDQGYIDQLQGYLSEYQKETGETFRIQVFRDGMQLAFDYQPVYDILLLDVQMPNMDGITAASRIRKDDRSAGLLPQLNNALLGIFIAGITVLMFLHTADQIAVRVLARLRVDVFFLAAPVFVFRSAVAALIVLVFRESTEVAR